MNVGVLSIRYHHAFGNIAIGAALLILSIARTLNPNSWLTLVASVCLLALAALSLFVCLSPHHEPPDEMTVAHDGVAAGHALRATLIVAGATCATSMALGAKMDFTTISMGLMGFGLLAYGAIFAWLER